MAGVANLNTQFELVDRLKISIKNFDQIKPNFMRLLFETAQKV